MKLWALVKAGVDGDSDGEPQSSRKVRFPQDLCPALVMPPEKAGTAYVKRDITNALKTSFRPSIPSDMFFSLLRR